MKPNTRKALRLLKDAGAQGITTGEFLNAGIGRFSARISELREAGHHIVSRRESNNRHRYFLRSPSSPASDADNDDVGLGGNAQGLPLSPGVQARDRTHTTPSGSTSPAGSDPSPRVRRGAPRFSYDHPPSITGEWVFCIDAIPGHGTDSYWLRTDVSDQKQLVGT